MSNSDVKSLVSLNCEDRYDYCLSQVVEEKEFWILVNDDKQFLKIFVEEEGYEYLPIWPSSELAVDYCKDSNELQPKCISLPEFFKKWVPGLKKDSLEIGVFPGSDTTVWITEPSELMSDLQDELSNF